MQDKNDSVSHVPRVSEEVRAMIEALGWQRFHTPRNLAVAIVLEASELLQLFQWETDEKVDELLSAPAFRRELLSELADININLLSLCDCLGVDLNQLTAEKCRAIVRRFRSREGLAQGCDRNEIRCTSCRRVVKADWRYCCDCGADLLPEGL